MSDFVSKKQQLEDTEATWTVTSKLQLNNYTLRYMQEFACSTTNEDMNVIKFLERFFDAPRILVLAGKINYNTLKARSSR